MNRRFALILLVLCALTMCGVGAGDSHASTESSTQSGTEPAKDTSADATTDSVHEVLARTVRIFDFEERGRGNFEPLPMGWMKVEGPGLPHYVNGQMDRSRKYAGDWSFRFDLNGGSLIYRYPAGQIRVAQGSSYRADVWVSTTPMRHARARLVAYLADIDGRPLPNTVVRSELFASDGVTTWKQLRVDLRADDPAAHSIAVELQLIQPDLFETSTLGQQELFVQDIRGSAWFDDLRVAQVPQVRLETDRPGNIFIAGESATLIVDVVDQLLSDLDAKLEITDALGKIVHQRSGPLTTSHSAQRDVRALIELPGSLPTGWYTARLGLSAGGQFVGERVLSFVISPAVVGGNQNVVRDPRISLVTSDLDAESFDELAGILENLGAGRVKLSVWTARADIAADRASEFERLLDRLGESTIQMTASLDAIPPSIRARASRQIGPDQWDELTRMATEKWQPQLAYLLSRHASRIESWQFLPDSSAERFARDPSLRRTYEQMLSEFGKLLGKPPLAMPWPAWYALEDAAPETLTLNVGAMILPGQIALYTQEAEKENAGRELAVRIEPINNKNYGRLRRLRDWTERVTSALAVPGLKRVELPLPFSVKREAGRSYFEPDETALVTRTLLRHLSQAQYRGLMPIATGVQAHCFERDGLGVLVMWNTDNATDAAPKKISVELGSQAKLIDIFGNALPMSRNKDDSSWEFTIGMMPVFVIDAEPALARFRASVMIDNTLLESSFEPHTRMLKLTNTFREPVAGSIRITGPTGWSIVAANPVFSLNPGETFTTPVQIEFPFNGVAGEKVLRVSILLESRQSYRLDLPLSLRLGLSDVGLQSLAVRKGGDIFVQQMITNYGNSPINYTAFVQCPGLPRQERLVSELAPGKTTVRKYRLTGVNASVQQLRSGLREMDGIRVLNDEIDVR